MNENLRKRKNSNDNESNAKKSPTTQPEQHIQPNLIVVEHFDLIKNQIDIETESRLQELIITNETIDERKSLIKDNIKSLNDQREKQIEKIDQIQEKVLVKQKFNQENWRHVLNDTKLTFEKKVERIKEELLTFDCLRLNDEEYKSDISLWIVPWFYNEENLKFLRYANIQLAHSLKQNKSSKKAKLIPLLQKHQISLNYAF